ncbi:MAG TPA: hypothetical protein VF017_22645 [Thermoanaerobaculia bacterium]|nr:hypothetical protein [Thermoanaerobaculia bacterium]
MSEITELPCPHCRAPLALKSSDFDPWHEEATSCPACGRWARLPRRARMLAVLSQYLGCALVMLTIKPFDLFEPETPLGFAVTIATFLAIAWMVGTVGYVVCRRLTRGLVR